MKPSLKFLFILLLVSSMASAQELQPNSQKVGLTFSSFGENDLFRINELIGAASYSGKGFSVFGLSYEKPLNKTFSLETGLEYGYHKMVVHPNVPPGYDSSIRDVNFSLLSIPFTMKLVFLKYAFVQAGLFMDVDLDSPTGDLTGIGSSIGFGLNYEFKSGISLFVNPYAKFHTLLPLSMEKYPHRLWESGVRVGVMYQL